MAKAKPPTTAAQYRKRADEIGTSLRKRKTKNQGERRKQQKKQKALDDMADNEDWLNGKVKEKD